MKKRIISLVLLGISVLTVTACAVLQAQSAAQAEQSQSGYRDGTYEGSAFGFGDVIRVSVTIQSGKMTDIAVLDASGEDKPYYKPVSYTHLTLPTNSRV